MRVTIGADGPHEIVLAGAPSGLPAAAAALEAAIRAAAPGPAFTAAAVPVVARRLAANPDARILLVEAGPLIRDAATDTSRLWPSNIGGDRDWAFRSEPEPQLSDRVIELRDEEVVVVQLAGLHGVMHDLEDVRVQRVLDELQDQWWCF